MSVTVTTGTGCSTISRISVCTCGAGAEICLLRGRDFLTALLRVTFLARVLALFLAALLFAARFLLDLLATLDALALACFFAGFLYFRDFDLTTRLRVFRLAIFIPFWSTSNSESV
jgi:hypothetical protein